MQKDNRRTLQVGHLEIVAVVQAPLNNTNNYNEGITISTDPLALRIIVGNNFANYEEMIEQLRAEFKIRKPEMKRQLKVGDFNGFATSVMLLADNSLDYLKHILIEPVLVHKGYIQSQASSH